ncbi:MAG: 2Fe-2S iron-sulfur cluster-binding protein [Candidatus Bathyarchaeia archaeon]
MKTIEFEIDEKKVRAREGMTILEAAKQSGVNIPTLCYHENLDHLGCCRICSVYIEKGKRGSIVTACSYPVEEGLKVTTRSQKIDRLRKTIIELAIVGSGPNIKADLYRLSKEYNADLNRFSSIGEETKYNCILCGLCTIKCIEATGGAIGFVGRGVDKKIVSFPETSQTCITCNYCNNVCPTGRISLKGADPPFPTVNDFLSGRS